MIKLIASDMDGTLLNQHGEIPNHFWEIEKKLSQLGIYFCVASGRQYFNLRKLFSTIQDNVIFMAENGAIVLFQGNIIFENSMPKTHLQEWNSIIKNKNNVQLIFCGKKSAYIEKPKNENLLLEIQKYYSNLEVVEDFENIEDDLLKVAICDPKGAEKNLSPLFQKYEKDYQVVVSGGMWLDIMNPTTNKGTALEKIKEFFQIQQDELLIFGDYLNDYEMMSCGHYSFAMENAHSLLKEKANYMAPSNQEEGVLKIIEDFIK